MFILALDYDGTLFEGSYTTLGNPKFNVINKVVEFRKNNGCQIVLWTCRDGSCLQEAVSRCLEHGLYFDSVNSNCPYQVQYMANIFKETQHIFSTRKIYADLYVDDKSPGSIEYFLSLNVEETCKLFQNRT